MNLAVEKMILPEELTKILKSGVKVILPETRNELIDLALGGAENNSYEVKYDIEGNAVLEATVARCKNGVVINYPDPYIRRRDPDCMVIADDGLTDKVHYRDKFGEDFKGLRDETFEWMAKQDLILVPFMACGEEFGIPVLMVGPANAGFFAAALADLQGFIPASEIKEGFKPKAIIYVAPPFRHTHFDGKQIVVHNRLDHVYELFSYNLYPGPSAKKGVYGVLLKIGEEEGWVTVHGSTVMVVTPYENIITIMHESASGGGKSEMTEQIHRELDGKIILGKNTVTGEVIHTYIKESCDLRPVTDDMAICHPSLQKGKKLAVKDAEYGWFLRTDHITKYGTDPYLESMTVNPPEPLIFINFDAVPGGTALVWDPIMDAPGKPCSNPRVIMPRTLIKNIVNESVEIDVRSFGVRVPPCTKENPTYGIMGLFHILPPALAWLWRLVAPRGHANPSIIETGIGMVSEGVGSYWPFATGKRVDQANLLLNQIKETTSTRYILVPNQHIGVYKVGFMPQWIAREYLARRGSAKFNTNQLVESRLPILGYSLNAIKVDGLFLPKEFLEVNRQPEVGDEGFDAGAAILTDFFKKEISQFLTPDLDPLGREIIECCLNDGSIEDYIKLMPMRL